MTQDFSTWRLLWSPATLSSACVEGVEVVTQTSSLEARMPSVNMPDCADPDNSYKKHCEISVAHLNQGL